MLYVAINALNPTHVSGWIVNLQPTARVKLFRIPPTRVGGLFIPCHRLRSEVKLPPTAVGGIHTLYARSVGRRLTIHPLTWVGLQKHPAR